MIVFRLCKSLYADDLSGKGAELFGGRWNQKGIALLYTADSRALCLAELSVHLPIGLMPRDFEIVEIEIPDSFIELKTLPKLWNSFPYEIPSQKIGEQMMNENTFILKVPSAIIKGEFNFLINPKHKDSSKIKIINNESFNFDARMFNEVSKSI